MGKKRNQNEILVTEDHIKLLSHMHVDWNESDGIGAPTIDPKNPYGDGDVAQDISEILEWDDVDEDDEDARDKLEEKALAIHKDMKDVLQIYLMHAGSEFEVGTYEKEDEYDSRSWVFKG